MCKKKDFPVVMNVFLAFFITLAVTIFNLLVNNNLNVPALVVSMIYGFCLNMTLETIIDLPAFGNFFVKKFGLKMESLPAYFVRIFFIVLLLVLLGCVREWLAAGTMFGVVVSRPVLPMASMPAGGFIVLGVLCAVWRALAQKRKAYLTKEARNLVDVHSQKEADREQ